MTEPKKLDILRGKEDVVKWIYVALVASIALGVGYYLLPYVILALENILWTAALAAIVGVVGYVALSPTFQQGAIYFLDNMILRLRNLVIQSDPFSTAQNAIKKLKNRRDEMLGYVERLRGSRRQLEHEIQSFTNERTKALKLAQAADSQGNTVQASRYAHTASRLKESIERLQPMLDRTEALNVFLDKMFQLLDAKIGEADDSLQIALREYSIMETSGNAVKEARRAMSGPDQEMFEESMRSISDRTFALVGEVEMFMDITKPLIEGKEFEDQAGDLSALAEFREWVAQDTELLPKEAKRQLLIDAGQPVPIESSHQDKYGLLTRKEKMK